MTDLIDFLLARIAEDEEAARAAGSRKWDAVADFVEVDDQDGELPTVIICKVHYPGRDIDGEPTRARATHIARWDPTRVLAEAAAKRAIVREAQAAFAKPGNDPDDGMADLVFERVLGLLALPYADHPDYRSEWRP